MKTNGTVHAWGENYFFGAGNAVELLMVTDMLRYITTRSAQYVQERLEARGVQSYSAHPLKYSEPKIEVRPFTPEY